MPKPIIAVDIDDVLAQSTESLRLEVNRRLGVNLNPEDYQIPGDYWGYYELVWGQHGLSGQITMDALDPQMKADQSHVLPHDDAFEVLNQLKIRYELMIITGRNSSWRTATEAWLDRHFPNIFSELVFGEGYEGMKHRTKGELCLEHGASWLIDDNVEHAHTAYNKGVNILIFGNYGWHHSVPPHMQRCRDWKSVEKYFEKKMGQQNA